MTLIIKLQGDILQNQLESW